MLRALDHFEINRRASIVSERERRKWFIAAREQKERREDLAERADEALIDVATAMVLATPEEVVQFQTRLDEYDRATIQALMENTEALDQINHQISGMLKRAHIMEDGRRVFKSEDGTWAVDQDGNRLNPEEDDIESIAQTPDTAEAYLEVRNKKKQLTHERKRTLEFQRKLDSARERSQAEDFGKNEREKWDAELQINMPSSVKARIPRFANQTNLTSKGQFTQSATATNSPAAIPEVSAEIDAIPMPS